MIEKKKRGRKALPLDEKRSVNLQVSVTPEVNLMLTVLARAAGSTVSSIGYMILVDGLTRIAKDLPTTAIQKLDAAMKG